MENRVSVNNGNIEMTQIVIFIYPYIFPILSHCLRLTTHLSIIPSN